MLRRETAAGTRYRTRAATTTLVRIMAGPRCRAGTCEVYLKRDVAQDKTACADATVCESRRRDSRGASDGIVAFEFSVQRGEVYAENVGGAGLVVVDGGEGVEDVAALDLFECGA